MVTWQITENFHSRTSGTFRDLINGKKEKLLFSINEQGWGVVSIVLFSPTSLMASTPLLLLPLLPAPPLANLLPAPESSRALTG